ncbi:hypothetical protein M8818_003331 [Zalaria obscura]|uniref:Uncharacterized protein n=1 Tax=Zalaria obscura TaxID=2024903 RepID=A0ACC3SEU3_9PEZI
MTTRPNILLFGAGAIGTIYIHILQQAGCNVTAVCRSNYAAAATNGFHISSQKYGNVHVSPTVVRTPQEAADNHKASGSRGFDYVLVTAKAFPGSSPTGAELLRPVVGPDTAIALVQNGIGIEDEWKAAYPENPILSCVVYLPATQTSPGHVSMGDLERLEIGTFPCEAPAAHKGAGEKLKGLIEAGGGTATLHDDVQLKRWSKALVNSSWNPVCALARSRDVAVMASSPAATEYVRALMREVAAVARACGYGGIGEEEVEMQLGRAKARVGTRGIEPSMMADALHGRRMEVEAIVGNVVRLGKERGVGVERLEGVYVLVKALDESLAAAREG